MKDTVTALAAKPSHLSADELRDAICALDKPSLLRLRQAARHLAEGRGVDAEDLVNEAILNCLAADRACPRDVPIQTFLFQVMRSLASSALNKKRRRNVDDTVDPFGESAPTSGDPAPSVEASIISEEEAAAFVADLDEVFADDPDAQLVITGLCQDMTREEIQTDCKLSDTAYNTIRRRIRRKINEHYPKGWKP